MIIKLEIDSAVKMIAEKYGNRQSEEVERKEIKEKFESNHDKKERKLIGKYGETVWYQKMVYSGIEFDVAPWNSNVNFTFNGNTFDIRTSKMRWDISEMTKGYTFLIPEDVNMNGIDYFINIQVNKQLDTAYVMGYIPSSQVENHQIIQNENMYEPGYTISMEELKSIKEKIPITTNEDEEYYPPWEPKDKGTTKSLFDFTESEMEDFEFDTNPYNEKGKV